VIVAVRAAPGGFDLEQQRYALTPEAFDVHLQAYEPLLQHPLRSDPGGWRSVDSNALAPALAASWDVAHDGRTYSVALKRGLRSAQGHELTAHDVQWSWERAFEMDAWGARLATAAGVPGPEVVRVAHTYTIQFRLPEPNPLFPKLLAEPVPAVYDIEALQPHCSAQDPWGEAWLRCHTAGFGAYALEPGPEPDEEVRLAANLHYWQGSPAEKRVLLRAIASPGGRVEALKRGSVDIAHDVPARQAKSLASDAAVKVVQSPGQKRIALRLDPAFPPFDQARLRRALEAAMAYEQIADEVFGDPAAKPPGARQDQREARSLLREAGYAAGFRLGLALPQDSPDLKAVADLIQLDVMRLGIKAVVEPMNPAVFAREKASRHLPAYLEEQLDVTGLLPPEQLEPLPEVHTMVLAAPRLQFAARASVQGFVRRPDGRPRYAELRKA
jgi:peptide/nickel transport system substrate-binding protein